MSSIIALDSLVMRRGIFAHFALLGAFFFGLMLAFDAAASEPSEKKAFEMYDSVMQSLEGDSSDSICRGEHYPLMTPRVIETPDFCDKPVAVLCSREGRGQAARQARIEREKKEMSRQALSLAAVAFGLSPNDVTLESVLLLPFPKNIFAYKRYTEELDRSMRVKIAMEEHRHFENASEKVRGLLVQALEQHLPRSLKGEVLRAIHATEVMPSWKLRMFPPGWIDNHKDLLGAFLRVCGPDGMADNGFAFDVAHDESQGPFVVVCPGAILGAYGEASDPKTPFANMAQILAHEFGHIVDHVHFPGAYHRFFACATERYADLLGYREEDTEVLKWINLSQDNFVLRGWRTNNHFREIIADYWSVKVLARYLDGPEGRVMSRDEKINFLATAYGTICDVHNLPSRNGVHPRSAVRVGMILGDDPEIRKIMGCKQPRRESPGACGLSGPVQ